MALGTVAFDLAGFNGIKPPLDDSISFGRVQWNKTTFGMIPLNRGFGHRTLSAAAAAAGPHDVGTPRAPIRRVTGPEWESFFPEPLGAFPLTFCKHT